MQDELLLVGLVPVSWIRNYSFCPLGAGVLYTRVVHQGLAAPSTETFLIGIYITSLRYLLSEYQFCSARSVLRDLIFICVIFFMYIIALHIAHGNIPRAIRHSIHGHSVACPSGWLTFLR